MYTYICVCFKFAQKFLSHYFWQKKNLFLNLYYADAWKFYPGIPGNISSSQIPGKASETSFPLRLEGTGSLPSMWLLVVTGRLVLLCPSGPVKTDGSAVFTLLSQLWSAPAAIRPMGHEDLWGLITEHAPRSWRTFQQCGIPSRLLCGTHMRTRLLNIIQCESLHSKYCFLIAIRYWQFQLL